MKTGTRGPKAPVRLRCEYLVDPLGIEVTDPRLSWEVIDPRRGAVQTAYQVLVASTPEGLAAGKGHLWDTGRVASDQSVHVAYAGRKLRSRTRCHWKVRTWDAAGKASPWSRPALWTMGLLKRSDWQARWIGYGGRPPESPRPALGVAGGTWVWYPEPGVDPKVAAPWCARAFRRRFSLPAGAEVARARFVITCDDGFELFVNGRAAGTGDGHTEAWRRPQVLDVTGLLGPGENVLAIVGRNLGQGPAGLTGRLVVETKTGQPVTVPIDGSWVACDHEPQGWQRPDFDDSGWTPVLVLGDVGCKPWGVPNDGPIALVCPLLRKGFRVARRVRRATVYVTALGSYEMHVNGKPVTEDLLSPGWTDFSRRVYYRAYDVTALVRKGANAIGAMLAPGWYGIRSRYGRDFRLLAQLEIEFADGTRQTVATDPSWRSSLGPVVSSDQYDGEVYDARREVPGWDGPGFDDSGWARVAVTKTVKAAVQAHPGAAVRRTGTLTPVGVREVRPGALLFDLGQNFTGWARLRVKGKAGTQVVLRFAEVLEPGGGIHTANLRTARCTDTYVLKGKGVEVWEPRFTFHGFRYVEVTGYPGRPRADAVTGIAVNSDTPAVGTFACSNPLLNKFWRNTTWTQRGNFLEIPTDCPQRDERLGWTGDAQIFIRTATCNMDVAAFFTKWLVDLQDAQWPDGAVPDVAPVAVATGAGTAAWGDAQTVCPWTLYQVYGDTRVLARHYGAMTRWVEYLRKHSENLLRPAAGYGDWVPAGSDTPRDVIATAYFAHSAALVARIAGVLGKKADARRYADLAEKVRAAFNKAYVADDARIKGDTQTCYALALHFDLLPEEKRAAAARRLVQDIERRGDHLSVGFVGAGSLLPALVKADRTDAAYRLMEQTTYPSWLYPVVHGSTSIWERWNGWTEEHGLFDPGMNSFAHYAYGSAGAWLYAVAAGIDTDGPGFKRLAIRPRVGGRLTHAKATFHSIHGLVASGWRLKGNILHLDVTIPANTAATVYVPAASPDAVTEGRRPAAKAEGVTLLGMDKGAAVYEVGAGTYAFTSRGVARRV